jgi:type I restriction enzyme M protein
LAGNVTGITRDEALAQQIINILFCKIYDEINTRPDEIVTFRSGTGEPTDEVKKRIAGLFQRVKKEYDDR